MIFRYDECGRIFENLHQLPALSPTLQMKFSQPAETADLPWDTHNIVLAEGENLNFFEVSNLEQRGHIRGSFGRDDAFYGLNRLAWMLPQNLPLKGLSRNHCHSNTELARLSCSRSCWATTLHSNCCTSSRALREPRNHRILEGAQII